MQYKLMKDHESLWLYFCTSFFFFFLLFCDEKKESGWITDRMSLGWMDGHGQIHLTKYVLCQWFDCSQRTEMSSAQKETLMNTVERRRLQCVIQQRAYLHGSPIPCKIYLNLIFAMLLSLWGYSPLASMSASLECQQLCTVSSLRYFRCLSLLCHHTQGYMHHCNGVAMPFLIIFKKHGRRSCTMLKNHPTSNTHTQIVHICMFRGSNKPKGTVQTS